MRIDSKLFIPAFTAISLAFLTTSCSSNQPETIQTPVSTISKDLVSPTPTPTPQSESPTLTVEGIPVDIICERLITASDLYAYNPNLSSFTPPAITAGTLGAISEAKGITCGYRNLSNGVEILIGIAKVSESSVTTLTSLIASNQISSANIPGTDSTVYYSSEGSSGVSQLIKGQYWIAISSPEFSNAENSIELFLLFLNKLP